MTDSCSVYFVILQLTNIYPSGSVHISCRNFTDRFGTGQFLNVLISLTNIMNTASSTRTMAYTIKNRLVRIAHTRKFLYSVSISYRRCITRSCTIWYFIRMHYIHIYIYICFHVNRISPSVCYTSYYHINNNILLRLCRASARHVYVVRRTSLCLNRR